MQSELNRIEEWNRNEKQNADDDEEEEDKWANKSIGMISGFCLTKREMNRKRE